MTKRVAQLSDLQPDKTNANKGTQRGRGMVEASLREVGAGRSIVVDKDGRVIAGNKTLEAWADVGGEIEVVRTDGKKLVVVQREDLDLSDDTGAARKLAYYDNRAGEVGLEWDTEQLLADLNAGVDLSGLFRQDELDELLADVLPKPEPTGDAEAQVDKAEELRQKWQVQTGQLWQLGDHRLICGDCTDADVVARVMGGEKARTVVTSPPYADQRTYQIGEFDWLALANGMFDALPIGDPCDILINLGLSYKDGRVNAYWQPWLDHCEKVGYPLYGWYVWDKGRGFPGEWNGRLAPAHEWIFHFSVGRVSANKFVEKAESSFERLKYKKTTMQRGQDGEWRPPSSMEAMKQSHKVADSVVRVWPDTSGVGDHPAIFPLGLPLFLMESWGNPGSIAFEPFSGSGTTIIACEQLGRKCRAVEISPGYVAVALQRWADATGKTPVLIS